MYSLHTCHLIGCSYSIGVSLQQIINNPGLVFGTCRYQNAHKLNYSVSEQQVAVMHFINNADRY